MLCMCDLVIKTLIQKPAPNHNHAPEHLALTGRTRKGGVVAALRLVVFWLFVALTQNPIPEP